MNIFFVLLLLFAAAIGNTQDYWLYIRKETKITDYNNPEQVAGFSDKGDIVEVVPCTPQYIPTKRESEVYKIVRVKDLKTLDKAQLKDTVRGDKEEVIKYRRHKIDISALGIKEVFEKDEIQTKITDKIDSKSIDFYSNK